MNASSSHRWLNAPYVQGGRDYSGLDCWGLVWLFYRDELGIPLPKYQGLDFSKKRDCIEAFKEIDISSEVREVEDPEHGDIVTMRQGKYVAHVGVWLAIDGGLCLHARDGLRVVMENIYRLNRDFKEVKFYRHNGANI